MTANVDVEHRGTGRLIPRAGLVAGPALGAALFFVFAVPLSTAGAATLGLMAWMAIWWLTEAIDIEATSLLPVAILPLVTWHAHGSASKAMVAAAAPYADPFIGLFLGGFILALSMERWGLHRRLALGALRFVGSKPSMIIGGFMVVTAAISMWVSNTATTAMMLPIAMSVTKLLMPEETGSPRSADPRARHFPLALMLGIAYAASIGGVGTLIGTPPNLLLAGFIEKELGGEVTFVEWLGVGLPLVAVFIPLTWLLLVHVIYPVEREPIEGGGALVRDALARLGPMNGGERVTLVVFMATALTWIFRPLIASIEIAGTHPFAGLTDAGVAIVAALALFVIPADRATGAFTMNWETARRAPFGILILFGGGLSLAEAVNTHGVGEFIGEQARFLEGLPPFVVVVAVITGTVFLSELTSNTAMTATLLPILAALAPALGVEPLLLLVPATIAASCAFMMPVGTPPNAMVFGSGWVTIPQMCRAGLWLNLIGIVLVTIVGYALALPILG